MTDKTHLDNRESLDVDSPLRRLVRSDVLEAAANRLMPLNGKAARAARWLPPVLRRQAIVFSAVVDSEYVTVLVESEAARDRMRQYWAKTRLKKFEGLLTIYPQRAILNATAPFVEVRDLTLKGGPICVQPDASVTLVDVWMKGRTNLQQEYEYEIPLAFTLRFGSKIRPLTAGSHMDALIAYGLARWRKDATS